MMKGIVEGVEKDKVFWYDGELIIMKLVSICSETCKIVEEADGM